MRTYLIERQIPGADKLSPAELRVISQKSNEILASLGPDVKWLHSYIVEDRIYCVYEAAGTPIIEEHARCMGIPANAIMEVHTIISPATGLTP